MRRLLREPLLHFFVLGAVLFGLYTWLHRSLPSAPNEIVVSPGQVASLQAQFQRVWQRPPTAQELQGMVDNWVREEIFYREGLAMGLDRDDPVVRRRISQKMQFIVDSAVPAAPTAKELQAWLDAHPDKYAIEPTYSLRQIYFDPARHKESLDADIATARRALDSGRAVASDSTLLPGTLDAATATEVGRVFGTEFAQALKDLPVGRWQGPVRSGFGMHLVEVRAVGAGRSATLAEVRTAVERDLVQARTQEATDAVYQRLRANYVVRMSATADSSG